MFLPTKQDNFPQKQSTSGKKRKRKKKPKHNMGTKEKYMNNYEVFFKKNVSNKWPLPYSAFLTTKIVYTIQHQNLVVSLGARRWQIVGLKPIISFTFNLVVFALWNSTWHANASLDDLHLAHNNDICLKRAFQVA